MNKTRLDYIDYIIIFCMIAICTFIMYIFYNHNYKTQDYSNIKVNTGNNNTITTTGVSIEVLTGSVISGNIEIPQSSREYLDYILQNGVAGTDFVVVEPPRQPIIRSSDKKVNNDVMYDYFRRNIITFSIPDTKKKGYIMFVTNREVPETRDLFLAINGKSQGAIRKNRSLVVSNINEYLYTLDNITMAGWDGAGINTYQYINNNKLQLNAFVGEQGNYIEKIIIFFK